MAMSPLTGHIYPSWGEMDNVVVGAAFREETHKAVDEKSKQFRSVREERGNKEMIL